MRRARVENGDLPVGTLGAVLIQRADPVLTWDFGDRVADALGQINAYRVVDLRVATPVDQLVAGARGVDAQQQLDVLDVLLWNLRQGGSATVI